MNARKSKRKKKKREKQKIEGAREEYEHVKFQLSLSRSSCLIRASQDNLVKWVLGFH